MRRLMLLLCALLLLAAPALAEVIPPAYPVPDYVEENVSIKVVKLIQSYTGVVNKMVWRKY